MFQYKKSLLDWQITGCGSGPRQNLIVRTSKFPPFSDPDVDERGGLFLLLLFSFHGSNSIPQILVILIFRYLISSPVSLKKFFKKQYNFVSKYKFVIISSNCLPKPYWKKVWRNNGPQFKMSSWHAKAPSFDGYRISKVSKHFDSAVIVVVVVVVVLYRFPSLFAGFLKSSFPQIPKPPFLGLFNPEAVVFPCYFWILAVLLSPNSPNREYQNHK